MEVTESLLKKVQQFQFLVELDDRIRPLVEPSEITLAAATFLGTYLNVNRCAYAHVEKDQNTFQLTGNYTNGASSIVGRYESSAFGAEFLRLSRAGRPYIVEDAEIDGRIEDVRDAYRKTQIRSVVSVPVVKGGRFVAGMAVHQTQPRRWTDDEVSLIGMVAYRCWESIERNRVTQALYESEAKFRTMTNAIPQMVWTARPDGSVDYFNDQMYEFTGVPHGSTEGTAWANVVHPEDREQASQRWSHSVQHGSHYESTYRVRHYSGEYRWSLARAYPVKNDHGAVLTWMGTNTDIHLQKLAEEALQESNRRKDEFLAMLAHELRNPLAPISAAAELLFMTSADDANVRKATAIISRQVKHVTGLVDDLLDVSRVTRGLVTLQMSELDMKSVIAHAAEQVRPLIERRKHRFSIHLHPESVYVWGDRKRLVQVIGNLLDNAAKFTPEEGHITLTLQTSQTEIVLTVSDSGIGMAPELLRNAFELFHQGERTIDRTQGGLGIGLALAKALVEQHNGTIYAMSSGLGKGSELRIRMPRLVNTPETPEKFSEQGEKPPQGLKILLVDDNVDAAQMTAMLLEHHGHDITVVNNAIAALEKSQGCTFDVYLLDIGLPEINGYELAKRILAQGSLHKGVLVALTGYGQDQDKQASSAAGFAHHFVKPVDFSKLMQLFGEIKAARATAKN